MSTIKISQLPAGTVPAAQTDTFPLVQAGVTTQSALLFQQSGGTVLPIQNKLAQRVCAFDFMTSSEIADVQNRTAELDVTDALKAAVDYVQALGGGILHIPAGVYLISTSLVIGKGILIEGEGADRTTIKNSAGGVPAFDIHTSATITTIFGGGIRNLAIDCASAGGDGVTVTAVHPYPITRMVFENIIVFNCRNGFYLTSDTANIVYMNRLQNILVAGITANGFYSTGCAYNVYDQIEASNVANTGRSFNITDAGASLRHLTCEGVSFIDVPYGTVDGYVTETISASSPVTDVCVKFNRALSVRDVTLVDVDNAKCQYGIVLGNSNIALRGVNFVYTTATPSNFPILVDAGGTGVIENVSGADGYLIESYNTTISADFKLINCPGLTDVSNVGVNLVDALPAADVKYRGNVLVLKGTAGVADHAYVCVKEAAGTYAWQQMDN